MTSTPSDPGAPAGWYPDHAAGVHRWWDGQQWTEHTAPLAYQDDSGSVAASAPSGDIAGMHPSLAPARSPGRRRNLIFAIAGVAILAAIALVIVLTRTGGADTGKQDAADALSAFLEAGGDGRAEEVCAAYAAGEGIMAYLDSGGLSCADELSLDSDDAAAYRQGIALTADDVVTDPAHPGYAIVVLTDERWERDGLEPPAHASAFLLVRQDGVWRIADIDATTSSSGQEQSVALMVERSRSRAAEAQTERENPLGG